MVEAGATSSGANSEKVKAGVILESIAKVLLFVELVLGALMVGSTIAGYQPMYVVSDSMVPTFRTGDLVVMNTKDTDVKPKDIIGYHPTWLDGVVTHRVINVDGDKVTVKGDNNHTADPVFTKDKIVGTITLTLPKIGYLLNKPFIIGWSLLSVLLLSIGLFLQGEEKTVKKE